MTAEEAQQVADFINSTLDDVSALVEPPERVLRLVWDRESVALFKDGLVALQAVGRRVPQGIIDNLDYWLTNVAERDTGS